MLYNLLALETTDIVVMISVVALLLLFALLFLIGKTTAALDTKKLSVIALSIALTTTLSFLKVQLPFGGSVTFFSLVPVIIVAYYYGFYFGLLTGFVTSLLQFITSPWILTPLTFVLDYIFAFSLICVAGIFKKIIKEKTLSLTLGTMLFFLLRFSMHLISGIVYFKHGVISDAFPTSNAFIYSLCYNLAYILPDMIFALLFLIPFSRTKTFKNDLLFK
ncbi:MAG: energy-coupled thiamine transporter ThiT [Clostridia bacterium]|nr:energy-coupled thiamine transporter ThiT [Clostridia bacterium]